MTASLTATSPTIAEAIRAFNDSQDAEGYTPATHISYYKILVVLARYLQSLYNIERVGDVTDIHLKQWMMDLCHEPGRYGERSSRTIQTYCRHMRPFFHWLYANEYISSDPAVRIKLPKAKKTLIRIFEGDEIDQLQKACEPPDGSKATYLQKRLAARNHTILDLLLDTGIRRSEICTLRKVLLILIGKSRT